MITANLDPSPVAEWFQVNLNRSCLLFFYDLRELILPYSRTSQNLMISLDRVANMFCVANSTQSMLVSWTLASSLPLSRPCSSENSQTLMLTSAVTSKLPWVFQAMAVGHFLCP